MARSPGARDGSIQTGTSSSPTDGSKASGRRRKQVANVATTTSPIRDALPWRIRCSHGRTCARAWIASWRNRMDALEHYLDQVCRGVGGPWSLRKHIRRELREHLLD